MVAMLDKEEADKMSGLEFLLDPSVENNIYYYGNLNLMLSAYDLVSDDDTFSKLNDMLTKRISNEIIESNGANLVSLPIESWSADMPVALASLKIYDDNYGTDYSSKPIELWKKHAKENLMDEDGNLYATMDTISKKGLEKAKGGSLGYSIIFTSFFDKDFSNEMYDSFKKSFHKSVLGINMVKEFEDGSSVADVDSGPIIYGVGSVASAFGMGAAKVSNDPASFQTLSLAAELVTLPFETFSGKEYLANISLGETALLFNRTLRPWK